MKPELTALSLNSFTAFGIYSPYYYQNCLASNDLVLLNATLLSQ